MTHSALDDTMETQIAGRIRTYMEKTKLYSGWQAIPWHFEPQPNDTEPNDPVYIAWKLNDWTYDDEELKAHWITAEFSCKIGAQVTGKQDTAKRLVLLKDQLKKALQANPHLALTDEDALARSGEPFVIRAWVVRMPGGVKFIGGGRALLDIIVRVRWIEQLEAGLPDLAWDVEYG